MKADKAKLALVTGASRGIGQAIAQKLAKDGFYVIGTATSPEGAASIEAALRETGGAGEGLVLDLSKKENIDDFMARLADHQQQPLVLVNNAGITQDDLLLRMEDEAWERVIQTNLSAVFYLSRACLRFMVRSRWGRIINIGSVVGASGNPGQANYAAAKAGLVGFSKSLALEIGSRGITVNVVAPGFIDTDMTKAISTSVREEMLKHIPLKRLGQPQEVAALVGFLASEDAGYLTGETLQINGGLYMQ